MVVHACNPTFGRLSQKYGEFKDSLGYITFFCLKKEKKEEGKK
jgi:hypothetical protein